MPELINEVDAFGKTALYYAAAANSVKTIHLLLSKDISCAYIADNDGISPLLVAASLGHSLAVQAILDYCPDSIELVDKNGRNALHLAVRNSTRFKVRKLLKVPILKELLNEPDDDGNTPLHLATKNHHYLMVKELVGTKCVDLKAKNKAGFTVLDICESEWELSFQRQYMWRFLRKHKASRGRRNFLQKFPLRWQTAFAHPKADLKQMANTLSVVAALLATVTFAAAFTIPGGYNSNGDPNEGIAVLVKKAALKAFVLSDTIAMCSSMIVVFLLIWAMVGDPAFLYVAVTWSQLFLIVSLIATMVAFITGIYVVIAPVSLWLAIIVCLIGSGVPFLVNQLHVTSSISTPYIIRMQRAKTGRPIL